MGFIIYLPPSQQHISCENEHVMHKSICISPRVNVRRANIYMHMHAHRSRCSNENICESDFLSN